MSNVTEIQPGQKAPLPVTKKRKRKTSAFQKLREKVQLTREACAELCGVNLSTIYRWEYGEAPVMATRLLQFYDRRSLDGVGPGWSGFRFSRGKLVSGKLSFTPRNLRQIPHYVDVYNRIEIAKIRYEDGLPLEQCLGIVFGSSAFREIPLLEDTAG